MATAVATGERRRLEEAARQAAGRSYCPYSGFAVGAAVMTPEGEIFAGCNVENASFGLTVCAERAALFAAVAAGRREFSALAVYTLTSDPCPPCGACLQVLAEFAPRIAVICLCESGGRLETDLPELLPQAFSISGTPVATGKSETS